MNANIGTGGPKPELVTERFGRVVSGDLDAVANALARNSTPEVESVLSKHAPRLLDLRQSWPTGYDNVVHALLCWHEAKSAAAAGGLVPASQLPKRRRHCVQLLGRSIDLPTYRSTAKDRQAYREWVGREKTPLDFGSTDPTADDYQRTVQKMLDGAAALKDRVPSLRDVPAEEAMGLEAYTGDGEFGTPNYTAINTALRNGDDSALKKHGPDILFASAALNRVPGWATTVYRTTNLSADAIEGLKPGTEYLDPGFCSASLSKRAAMRFSSPVQAGDADDERRVIFEIDSAGFGKDVTAFSIFEYEAEVLFPPGTTFRVDARDDRKDGTTVIKMTAIP